MAQTDHDSAIDDSFEANFFPAPPSSAPSGTSTLLGPRSGHWSVKNGVGSAVDDSCPTVWNQDYRVQGQQNQDDEPTRAIGGGLLKKLELATIEEDKKKPVAHDTEAGSLYTTHISERMGESKPRGFYVPASVDRRELKQIAKAIKPKQPPPAAKTKKEKKQRYEQVC